MAFFDQHPHLHLVLEHFGIEREWLGSKNRPAFKATADTGCRRKQAAALAIAPHEKNNKTEKKREKAKALRRTPVLHETAKRPRSSNTLRNEEYHRKTLRNPCTQRWFSTSPFCLEMPEGCTMRLSKAQPERRPVPH